MDAINLGRLAQELRGEGVDTDLFGIVGQAGFEASPASRADAVTGAKALARNLYHMTTAGEEETARQETSLGINALARTLATEDVIARRN